MSLTLSGFLGSFLFLDFILRLSRFRILIEFLRGINDLKLDHLVLEFLI